MAYTNATESLQAQIEKSNATLKLLVAEMVQGYFGESSGFGLVGDQWVTTDDDMSVIMAVKEDTGLTFGNVIKFKCAIDTKTKRIANLTYSINSGEAHFVCEQDALDYFFAKYGIRFKTWGGLEVAMYEKVDMTGRNTFVGGVCKHGSGNFIYV